MVLVIGFGYLLDLSSIDINSFKAACQNKELILFIDDDTQRGYLTAKSSHLIPDLSKYGQSYAIGGNLLPSPETALALQHISGQKYPPTLQTFTWRAPKIASSMDIFNRKQSSMHMNKSNDFLHIKSQQSQSQQSQSQQSQSQQLQSQQSKRQSKIESIEPIEKQFREIANKLCNQALLIIKGETGKIHTYRFIELEFYYYHEAEHADLFTHCDILQQHFGTWYFHRSGKSFRNGTFKGLDIVFGDEHSYGGILIRTIQNTESNEIISGTSCCVDHILTMSGHTDIQSLVDSFDNTILFSDNSPLYIKMDTTLTSKTLYSSPRIGLSLKKHKDPVMAVYNYLMADYRFTTMANLAKGRLAMICSLIKQGYPDEEIRTLSGSTNKAISNYRSYMQTGSSLNSPAEFAGKKLNSQQFCKLFGFIRK